MLGRWSSFFIRSMIVLGWTSLIFALLIFSTSSFFTKKGQSERTLDVFCWPDMLLPEVIDQFERETGIKVVRHYYGTNEEMIAKLSLLKGKGYDLIFPSDYAVKILKDERLLQPLDHSKVDFLRRIHPFLKRQQYDPHFKYAIPYQWELFGVGVDTKSFKEPLDDLSWNHIFNRDKVDGRIIMSYDLIEATTFAAYHLFGPINELTKGQKKEVENLLKEQIKWVESYSTLPGDYFLATKNCALAVSLSSHIFRGALNHPHLAFKLPQGAKFASIENVCIPSGSEKKELVYKLLNFLYKKENVAKECSLFLTFPAITDATFSLEEVPQSFLDSLEECAQSDEPLSFVKPLLPEKELRDLWIKVRVSPLERNCKINQN